MTFKLLCSSFLASWSYPLKHFVFSKRVHPLPTVCRQILAMLMNVETQQVFGKRISNNTVMQLFVFVFIKKAPGDECQRAAGIYECCNKKAPEITNEIQRQLTADLSNPPAVIQIGTCCTFVF